MDEMEIEKKKQDEMLVHIGINLALFSISKACSKMEINSIFGSIENNLINQGLEPDTVGKVVNQVRNAEERIRNTL